MRPQHGSGAWPEIAAPDYIASPPIGSGSGLGLNNNRKFLRFRSGSQGQCPRGNVFHPTYTLCGHGCDMHLRRNCTRWIDVTRGCCCCCVLNCRTLPV